MGYTGGKSPWPTYDDISDHTEAVQVEYDPSIISFEDVLKPIRDVPLEPAYSTQYRSAIFYHDADQKATAERVVAGLGAEKFIAVEPYEVMYRAEDYHQDYVKKCQGYYGDMY